MHRRARHLASSLKSAGAVVSFHAPSITNLADGANVSSWADTAGGITASLGSATAPTFTKSYSGGQAGIAFAATSAANIRWLSFTITQPIGAVILAATHTSSTGNYSAFIASRATQELIANSSYNFLLSRAGSYPNNGSSNRVADAAGATYSNVFVNGANQSTANYIDYSVGVPFTFNTPHTLAACRSSNSTGTGRFAMGKDSYRIDDPDTGARALNGTIGHVTLLPTVGVSLLKRLSHAVSLTFKIQSS